MTLPTKQPTELQKAAQTALDVQDACNLSGVLHSLDSIVTDVLWHEARRMNLGTDYVNKHPIVALFLSKLESLNGNQSYFEASDKVEAIVKAG